MTFAPHSPFSYCPGWSGFKRFWHTKLRTFSVAHSDWCWRDGALGHLGDCITFSDQKLSKKCKKRDV
jgi:hypothetical protein